MGEASNLKVCMIGSGNWGSAVATLIGQNTPKYPEFFNDINMYVYEEEIDFGGRKRKLPEVINEKHENVKYLPNIPLPSCIKAVPDLKEAAKDADILIWVVPHQFVTRMVPAVKEVCSSKAISISLIKGGIDIKDGQIQLCSDLIKHGMGHDCSVLMGANLAGEVAEGQFCEATIGYNAGQEQGAAVLQKLFNVHSFRVATVADVPGVELCGALKNIVALGAGFSDGLGMGGNTKAAVIRIGLNEMQLFVKQFYPNSLPQTFFESCGVADLITTCFGGRNRRCAEAFAKAKGSRTWEDIEGELLNGQKLQGTLTCQEIVSVLEKNNCTDKFPFIMAMNKIAFQGEPCENMFKMMHVV